MHAQQVTQPDERTLSAWLAQACPRIPYSAALALVTLATAWPAAGYGALVIWVAGDFQATKSYWVFGWPFATMLVAATVYE